MLKFLGLQDMCLQQNPSQSPASQIHFSLIHQNRLYFPTHQLQKEANLAMNFITNCLWVLLSPILGQNINLQVIKFQIMKASPLYFYWSNGFCYRICICFWEEPCCLKKNTFCLEHCPICNGGTAGSCKLLPGCDFHHQTSPDLTASDQTKRNRCGLEGWTLFTHGIPMNIFKLRNWLSKNQIHWFFPKGKQMAPSEKVFPIVFQHSLFILHIEYLLFWRLKRRRRKNPKVGYCGICTGQRAFFCRESCPVIESHLPNLMSWGQPSLWALVTSGSDFWYVFPHWQRFAVTRTPLFTQNESGPRVQNDTRLEECQIT